MSTRAILSLFLFTGCGWAWPSTTLVEFDQPQRFLLNPDQVSSERIDGRTYYTLEPDTDPYSKNAFRFRLGDALSSQSDLNSLVLEINFLDKGAGVIQPCIALGENGASVAPSRQSNYTRLNTQRARSAYFEFPVRASSVKNAEGPVLMISGLQYLRSMRILSGFSDQDWNRADASIPVDVHPMVTLRRPMHLVTTAGIASQRAGDSSRQDLANIRELAPLAKELGFNAIEMYVLWRNIEPNREGEFDFSYYDRLVDELQKYGLKWFPLLVVGSAYALPDWFIESSESVGFTCLEHNVECLVQSIWSPWHQRHVTRVLQAFGHHYEPTGTLLGVRLGPSGNYGESQYPAGGNWPAKGRRMHIHIGLWCNDDYAREDYRSTLEHKYGSITGLNTAWDSAYADWQEVVPRLPQTILSMRQRLDQAQWYTDSMSDWCAWWAHTAADAMPNTKIYQSAGGWGFHEAGTDYSAQTKAMAPLHGGIRLTNETDSFDQNVYATRLATTAARLYGVDLGFEPASSHTARGVVGRIFQTATVNGDHWFTYHPNIFYHPMAVDRWLEYLPILDTRQDPVIDVAIYYPETFSRLDDSTFRHLYAWGFNPRAREIRREIEVDYLDERLIRDGFLDKYKVLVFVWGNVIERDVQRKIDLWIRDGGVAIYPSFPKGPQSTVEGDTAVFTKWTRHDTGQGAFYRFHGDMEPPSLYAEFIRSVLLETDGLHPNTREVLRIERPDRTYLSLQEDGHVLALNYDNHEARISFPDGREELIAPYGIRRINLDTKATDRHARSGAATSR